MRFTIRDLLWLTGVVALAVGWWLERREGEARVQRLEKALSDANLYDSTFIGTGFMPPTPPMVTLPTAKSPGP